MTTCSTCSSTIPDPVEQWPDGGDGTLCQVCWERSCSRSWWAMMRALGEAGLLDQEGESLANA